MKWRKLNIAMGAFTDTVRNNIKNNVGKILVLSSIADNAVDENLKKACQVCMADYFNSTFREIGEVLIGKAVDMLRVKQEAYKNMQGMFTSSTWNSILDSDPYLKKNAGKIKKITIGNYVKNKLGHLEPKAQTTKLSLKVSDKKKFSCTGISYLSNVKYVSNNSKVAKVNSSGVIQAKKPGTTYIRCKIEQYGNTYELKCKVTVKNS